ncbi:MAG: TniB family NTP-binding protein [Promethearchaeota archaeon]
MAATYISNRPNHFDPEIRSRIKNLLMERYIHTPQNAELWCLLEDLMHQVSPTSPKPKVMGSLIIGDSHSGKTTAVRQFIKAYLENVPEARENDVFYFEIPIRAHLKGMMSQMGRQLKIPDISPNPKQGYPTYVLVEKVAAKLWKNQAKLVVIDEFQNLFYLSGENRAEILSGFNDLANKSHIPIILVGLEGVDEILNVENYFADISSLRSTFSSRFSEFHFVPWKKPHDPMFVSLLKVIYKNCALTDASSSPFYTHENIREWLMEVTGGLTGKIIHLIKWAVRYIIRQNLQEKITKKVLVQALKSIQANGW